MVIWGIEKGGLEYQVEDVRNGQRCWVCGDRVVFPAVFYHGDGGVLWLHPECGAEMGRHLRQDGDEPRIPAAEVWQREDRSRELSMELAAQLDAIQAKPQRK